MSNLAVLHQQHASAQADSAFWCPAIGTASAALPGLARQLDTLAQEVARLPVRAAVTRPVVGQYLSMVRTLAAAWQARTRPALASALDMLAFVGHSMAQPAVQLALQPGLPDRQCGARALDAVRRRMAAPLAALDSLGRDVANYLGQMARASHELACDTALVTERLQADAVHAFLLSQQASALQSRLDDAAVRQGAHWLLGPHAEPLRQEMVLHASALEGVRRQLAQLQNEQMATRAEAEYLQGLLPALSCFLSTVDAAGAAIDTLRSGAASTCQSLLLLAGTLEQAPPGQACHQLQAALPHWALVSAAAAALPH